MIANDEMLSAPQPVEEPQRVVELAYAPGTATTAPSA